MSLWQRGKRSILLATVLTLVLSLVPLFVAPAAAQGCDFYGNIRWTTSLSPASGNAGEIVRSGTGNLVQVCYSGGVVTEVFVQAGSDTFPLGAVYADIVAPDWNITGANSAKPIAFLQPNTAPGIQQVGTNAVGLPGGGPGYMVPATRVDIYINYNNGTLVIRFNGKICSETACFKFKSEIKGNLSLDQ